MAAGSNVTETPPRTGTKEGWRETSTMGERPAHECMAAIQVENETLRRENAFLQSVKGALE